MDWDDFQDAIEASGFQEVSSALDGRLKYHENDAGFSITLVNGPRANLIFPSGPFRGRLFGGSGLRATGDRERLEELAQEVRSTNGRNNSNSGSRGRSGNEVRA